MVEKLHQNILVFLISDQKIGFKTKKEGSEEEEGFNF
jgi:hypothetical protein